MQAKPSFKEINKKLEEACRILSDEPGSSVLIISRFKWSEDWEELSKYLSLKRLLIWDDKLKILYSCLSEIKATDHFWRGHRFYCNKVGFENVELWEFKWISKIWHNKKLYIKFGFKDRKLCFLSFHPDNIKERS